jgi:hypothetical protein
MRLPITTPLQRLPRNEKARTRAASQAAGSRDSCAATSFRGSTQVHGAEQLAIWARKADAGFAKVIATRPQVSLLYYSPDGPGPKYLTFQGRARVESAANDDVYAAQIDGEKAQDPERKRVAVIIDVESVNGFGADGPFRMERAAG